MSKPLDGFGRMRSTINITPLVDVLLVLLIIFIMVTPVLTKALESQIPRKALHPLPAEYAQRQLVIHMHADGRLQLNHEEITAHDLAPRLREIFARRGGRRVIFLDADEETRYGAVIHIMDLCRDGGAQTIGVVPDSIAPSIRAGF